MMKNEEEVKVEEKISEEFKVRDHLREEREKIKSTDDLIEFIKKVEKEYNYGYGVAPRAIAQAALATAWYLSGVFGITGFQASCAVWDFIRDWNYSDNKCGLRIVDYDKMLYPQYEENFGKVISSGTWKALQEQAKSNLDGYYNHEYYCSAHPNVLAHWKSIAYGNVPFGYEVKEE